MKKTVKLRIVFMGTSLFAEEILIKLIKKKFNIVSVFTKPDRKTGRNKQLQESPVKKAATENKIKVEQPEKITEETINKIKDIKPDLIIVAAYGKILPQAVLETPGFGCLNVHASLLPKYRGPSPIQNALINGEKETGVTIMLMDEGIDTGDIISQKSVKIDKNEKTPELSDKLAKLGGDLLVKTIHPWIEGTIEPKKQNNNEATLCQLIEKEDGHIFWNKSAEEIYNTYRALHPWPGIFSFWETDTFIRRIKLNKISLLKKNPQINHSLGEVFQLADKVGVQTGEGIIILEEVQLEGKKIMAIDEFINGYKNFIGSTLK